MKPSDLNKYSMDDLFILSRTVNFSIRDVENINQYNDDEIIRCATYKLVNDPIMVRIAQFSVKVCPPIKLVIKKNLREYICYYNNLNNNNNINNNINNNNENNIIYTGVNKTDSDNI